MKFALITGPLVHHRYMINKLSTAFPENFCGVVIQKKIKITNPTACRVNFTEKLRTLFFKVFRLLYFKQNFSLKFNLPTLITNDVNSEDVISFLRINRIDFLIVYGGKIIKSKIIDIWDSKIINLHNGYSPDYRGSNTLFWPIIENKKNKTGITIHYLSREIDSGKIIFREFINPDNFIFPETLQAYSFLRTTSLVEILLNMKLTGIAFPLLPTKHIGKIYLSSNFTQDVKLKLRKKMVINFFQKFF